MHVDDIAAGDDHVFGQIALHEQLGHINVGALDFAFAHADQHQLVGAGGGNAAGHGEHVGQAHVEGFERVAAGAVDLPEHGHLVAANLQRQDADLRLQHEAAGAQLLGNARFGGRHGEPADIDVAHQREGDRAVFRHPGFGGEVGVLEDGDADDVAGAEHVFGIGGLGAGHKARKHQQAQQGLEQSA